MTSLGQVLSSYGDAYKLWQRAESEGKDIEDGNVCFFFFWTLFNSVDSLIFFLKKKATTKIIKKIKKKK